MKDFIQLLRIKRDYLKRNDLMQSPRVAEELFVATKSTMFAKVFFWLVIVVVVDGIMVPIYDPPPRPPCASYQNNPVGNAGGNKVNGYYGTGRHGNGYQVRDTHDSEHPATSDHSFSVESSETGRGIYPAYAYHVFY